jgi:citrate lyase subunit beta/citryl-CoA lyase
MKSKLFVPGSRPELFAKALAGEADALSFDLEDAVVPEAKPQARGLLHDLMKSEAVVRSAKTIIVRVNAFDTVWFHDDVAAIVQPGVNLINLPKPESVEQVRAAVQAIETAERANGVAVPIRLMLNIETPKAFRIAHELAGAHPRVAGLQLGLADLYEPLGIARHENVLIQIAMFNVRMAAAEAGVFAFDSSFPDVQDPAGFRAEAALACQLGYLGKSCIHPNQVALANAAFQPSAAEIAHSLKVVEAAQHAQEKGVGAYLVDGKMIDGPYVVRARAIVAAAERLGLLAR